MNGIASLWQMIEIAQFLVKTEIAGMSQSLSALPCKPRQP